MLHTYDDIFAIVKKIWINKPISTKTCRKLSFDVPFEIFFFSFLTPMEMSLTFGTQFYSLLSHNSTYSIVCFSTHYLDTFNNICASIVYKGTL